MKRVWRGDKVEVISGALRNAPDDKRIGEVLRVDQKKQRVYVSGVNVRRIAQRRSQENPQGGFIEKECSIHLSNVRLVEPCAARLADEKRKEQRKETRSGSGK